MKSLYKIYASSMRSLGFDRELGNFINNLSLEVPPQAQVLDVGCGTGAIGLQLLKRFPGSTLLATDLEVRFLKSTSENTTRLGINQGRVAVGLSNLSTPNKVKINGADVILEKETYDIISVGAAIGYSIDQENSMIELMSLLKTGGYFINIEMSEGVTGRIISRLYSYPVIPLNKMIQLVQGKGHTVISIPILAKYFPLNLTRTCLVVRKS